MAQNRYYWAMLGLGNLEEYFWKLRNEYFRASAWNADNEIQGEIIKKYENTWLAACPSRIAKNVPTVFVFYCKNVLEKVEVGLRSPKTRPLKPHLSSGNAENEFPEIRIEHHVFRTFSKSEQKR